MECRSCKAKGMHCFASNYGVKGPSHRSSLAFILLSAQPFFGRGGGGNSQLKELAARVTKHYVGVPHQRLACKCLWIRSDEQQVMYMSYINASWAGLSIHARPQ